MSDPRRRFPFRPLHLARMLQCPLSLTEYRAVHPVRTVEELHALQHPRQARPRLPPAVDAPKLGKPHDHGQAYVSIRRFSKTWR